MLFEGPFYIDIFSILKNVSLVILKKKKLGGGHWQREIFAAVSRAKGAIYANYLFLTNPAV